MRPIDADALFINLDGMMEVSPTGYIHGDTVADMISDAPTVEVTPKWTPCSERLPEESDYYLVTFDSITHPVGIFFFEAQYGGCWVDEMGNGLRSKFFVAWMPLPKPYEVSK